MAVTLPFQWGAGGEMVTPDQVKRKRDAAEALLSSTRKMPTDLWSGLNSVSAALVGNTLEQRAADAETAGREKAGALFSDLAINQDPNAIIAALTSPDAQWASDAQTSIASSLLNQGLKRSDPAYQLDLELKRAQLADAQTPDAQSLINTAQGIYDPNSNSWIQPPTAAAGGAPNVKGESDLRSEYNGINTVKDFGLQTQAYQRVLDSAKDPSPAGDLALIFNYMKVLDPGSTVREGEFATAQNSGSVPEQIMAQYNKVMSGERLVPEIRQDFVQRAGQLYQGAASLQQGTNDRYSGLAQQYGYDPSRIVAPVPTIGVMDPNFNVQEYLTPQGQLDPSKPLPVTNDAEYEAIPSGATFQAPDGTIRVKP